MSVTKLLIANRGEIAIRIARAAAELDIATVSVFSEDDSRSLHVVRTDEAAALSGHGARAYLDIEQLIGAAKAAGCDAVHPGYGFLSESAAFARACAQAGLTFVGPTPEQLALFGDKMRARALAVSVGAPVARGSGGATSLAEAKDFFAGLGAGGAMMIKAVAGGGGRGIRQVSRAEDIDEAFARCQSEATAAFGQGDVYVEELISGARHIEVQIAGDRAGDIVHLWERECSLQRRRQKLVEIAPSPSLPPELRERILRAALDLAKAAAYESLGTFEFLVQDDDAGGRFVFIEANPRLQVEHTVTEAVLGVDLVKAQLRLADGASLAGLGLDASSRPVPRGYAMQLRVNMEQMDADGATVASSGVITAFDPPSGPGVRVDSFGYAGYAASLNFDSLLAKLVVHSPAPAFAEVAAKARRALSEFRIEGVATNIGFLRSLLAMPEVADNRVDTRFVEDHLERIVAGEKAATARKLYFPPAPAQGDGAAAPAAIEPPDGAEPVAASMPGVVVSIDVAAGDSVQVGQQIAVLEAMKMEQVVAAPFSGVVRLVAMAKGDVAAEGQAIVFIEPGEAPAGETASDAAADLDAVRPDLAAVIQRKADLLDDRRPEAVARRRKTGQRTARENIADLCDLDSFMEYGGLGVAAQRRRRSTADLIQATPADGLITGIGDVNGALFADEAARCIVLAYDYTVLAGTQGHTGHIKTDRMMTLAARWRIPVVLFAEGGGGRPGDTDRVAAVGLEMPTFALFAGASGLVPRIGVVSGRCFAGNAALLGCCDVIIATRNASIGMGGPAMIEGGGLGTVEPDDVGPIAVQAPNGVVDVVVEDEAAAVAAAKLCLSYFQGPIGDWTCADQRLLRAAVPDNRLRAYDVRKLIETLADTGSVLELRPRFGAGIITAFVRVEGRPLGLIANNPRHLGGAIDADAADKAARFMQLCDAFDIPMLSLSDTPGFMVGPQVEKTAQVRHVSRMFVTAATLQIPFFSIVLRKGYGLGAMAMTAGSYHSPFFNVAWPTGEFGSMGIEGAVRLGFRKELEACPTTQERQALFEKLVAQAYEDGGALNVASHVELDDVIDPAQSRRWIVRGLRSIPARPKGEGKRRPFVDTW